MNLPTLWQKHEVSWAMNLVKTNQIENCDEKLDFGFCEKPMGIEKIVLSRVGHKCHFPMKTRKRDKSWLEQENGLPMNK